MGDQYNISDSVSGRYIQNHEAEILKETKETNRLLKEIIEILKQ